MASPKASASSPSTGRVWITAEEDGKAYVIDLAKDAVIKSIAVGPRPRSVAFTPDGSRAFLPSENGFTLAVVDTAKLVVTKTIKLGETMRAMGVMLSPDGKHIYVSTGRSKQVLIVDATSLEVVGSVEAGTRPWGIAVHPAGHTLYTANGPSNDVSVIDVATKTVRRPFRPAGQPVGRDGCVSPRDVGQRSKPGRVEPTSRPMKHRRLRRWSGRHDRAADPQGRWPARPMSRCCGSQPDKRKDPVEARAAAERGRRRVSLPARRRVARGRDDGDQSRARASSMPAPRTGPIPGWVFGLPELAAGQRDLIRQAKRIANPGCHATASSCSCGRSSMPACCRPRHGSRPRRSRVTRAAAGG